MKIARMLLCFNCVIGCVWFLDAAAASDGLAVRIDDDKVRVDAVDVEQALRDKAAGLLVWNEAGIDRWHVATPGSAAIRPGQGRQFDPRLTSGTRSASANVGAADRLSTPTLDQILGQVVIRGEGFVTPMHGGRHVNGKITIRRLPEKGISPYPKDSVAIYSGNRKLVEVPFGEAVQRVRWSEIADLPEALRGGLPAGSFTLRYAGGGNNTEFVVEDQAARDWIFHRADQLAELLGTTAHPLYRLIVAEELLNATDENGKPTPYLADVLDLIEGTPKQSQSEYLLRLKTDILSRLQGEQPEAEIFDPTGIAAIDEARLLISRSQWDDALKLLQPLLDGEADTREAGLAHLYTAVIHSESAAVDTAAAQAETHFQLALRLLQDAPLADRYRAHNNYANFLLVRAQDRLYNFSFQAAAGVRNPLLNSLLQWREARDHYSAALLLAEDFDVSQRAAVEVNLARAYVLLADALRTLCASQEELQAVNIDQVVEKVEDYAAAAASHQPDAFTKGAAAETLAHVAFRAGDYAACREHTARALAAYCQSGYLAGAEGGYRMLGMASQRDGDAKAALNELMVSQLLTEILRGRMSSGRSGLSRAGFFARRAYVNEQIVELLIESGDVLEALRFAELGKARSLQDLLNCGNVQTQSSPVDLAPDIDEVLRQWPADVVGLEYFLGTRRGWVFIVRNGEVGAFPLQGEDGELIEPQLFVADVTQFLQRMNFTARRMLGQYQSTGKFDSHWQEELAGYYSTLIPAPIRDDVNAAKTLVIVPHHVLHYFPFAALVTQTDAHEAAGFEMVMPKFLIEQGMALAYAPSLESWALFRDRGREPIRQVNAVGIVEFETAAALPGVELDLKNLRAQLGDRVRTLVEGDKASEAEVAKLLAARGMFFAATHGMNVADQPLTSFLLCHGDKQSDGHLTAAEIFARKVGADLVVMSACFTGLADRSPLPGDDLFGLQRAFLSSGASSVVAGLWDVYDGTGPILMNHFFEQLKQGEPVAVSLAEAQRKFIRDRRDGGRAEVWIHPYFWAVYTAAGSDLTAFEVKE